MYIEMFLSANNSILEEHLGFLQVSKSCDTPPILALYVYAESVCGTG